MILFSKNNFSNWTIYDHFLAMLKVMISRSNCFYDSVFATEVHKHVKFCPKGFIQIYVWIDK